MWTCSSGLAGQSKIRRYYRAPLIINVRGVSSSLKLGFDPSDDHISLPFRTSESVALVTEFMEVCRTRVADIGQPNYDVSREPRI